MNPIVVDVSIVEHNLDLIISDAVDGDMGPLLDSIDRSLMHKVVREFMICSRYGPRNWSVWAIEFGLGARSSWDMLGGARSADWSQYPAIPAMVEDNLYMSIRDRISEHNPYWIDRENELLDSMRATCDKILGNISQLLLPTINVNLRGIDMRWAMFEVELTELRGAVQITHTGDFREALMLELYEQGKLELPKGTIRCLKNTSSSSQTNLTTIRTALRS